MTHSGVARDLRKEVCLANALIGISVACDNFYRSTGL